MKRYWGSLKRILKTKDGKVLLENFISLSSLELIGKVIPLIVLPYLLRVIGFEKYGIIIFAGTLIEYFKPIVNFSFNLTATRDVAIFRNNQRKINIIYSKVLILKTLFFIISSIIIIILVFLIPSFYRYSLIYFLCIPKLLGYVFFPDWFFQGMERMKYITFLNVGIKIFFAIGIFLFIRKEADFWIYPLLYNGGYIAAGVVGQIILMKQFKVKLLLVKRRLLIQTVKNNIPIFLSDILPQLYNNTSTFLLGILTNTTFVGIYDAIKKIIDLAIKVIQILSRVFFPFLNRKKNAFNKYQKMMTVLGCALSVSCILAHPLIFWYLNIKYEYALPVLIILSMGLMGYTLYNIYGTNYFIVHRKDKIVMRNSMSASVLGVILAFPLIYYFNIIGAALNLTLARWIMGGGLLVKYKKRHNLPISN